MKPALGCVNVNMSNNIEFDENGWWAIDFQSVVHRSLGTLDMFSRCLPGLGKMLRNYLLFEIILTFALMVEKTVLCNSTCFFFFFFFFLVFYFLNFKIFNSYMLSQP